MFAAAAVAAAAALTAISTTQSSASYSEATAAGNGARKAAGPATIQSTGSPLPPPTTPWLPATGAHPQQQLSQYHRWNTTDPSPPPSLAQFHAAASARSLDLNTLGPACSSRLSATSPTRPYISWKQYAMQRRNSMQRRKFEISRRLEQASSANQKKTYNIQQFQAKKQKSTDLNESINSRRSFASDLGSNRLRRQNTIATTDSQDTRCFFYSLHFRSSHWIKRSKRLLICITIYSKCLIEKLKHLNIFIDLFNYFRY